ncbi:sodium:proton antiporter [Thermococcus sp. 9N3]|uniref:cation:proton antiporter n=1 Tax=Thermococcus sp. 9N3 TaxID=163002 RepID=UPI0014303302|nr:sodium:proton antiporter [Thermococcus sp. 9N3]NJE48849.1 sodium:proton antiporter [Thermococcus sp. 9N3]
MAVDVIARVLVAVLGSGIIAMLISRRYNISYVPLFIIAGMILGPIATLMPRNVAHELFDYVRVFGLVMILFTEGHNLSWKLLKRNLPTIATLDTVGLLITALLSAWFFSFVFHAPFLIGFLFGAIISATDPATLIPLFRQYRVKQDIETTIVTESIFNDPLGIVLTAVAIAMLVPQASGGLFASLSSHINVYGAAVMYFLYEVAVSIAVGIAVGAFGYWFIKKTRIFEFPEIEIFSLFLAFSGFMIGESLQASGYLVATVTGIILGNYKVFSRKEKPQVLNRVMKAIEKEVHFNESLAAIATVFIFVLLGASLDLKPLAENLWGGILVAYFIMLVARPIAALPILKWWGPKEYLFIALEGPRGVVPSALAALPLSLAMKYQSSTLTVYWGEVILAVTVITVLASVITETIWVPFLKSKLLQPETVEDRMRKYQEKKRARAS